MNSKILLVAAAALMASASASFAASELVTNGDFSAGLSGWTKSGKIDVYTDSFYQSVGGSNSSGANGNYLGIGSQNSTVLGSSIFQTLSTVIGQTYTLSFDYAGFGAGNGTNTQTLGYTIGSITSSFVSVPTQWLSTNLDKIFFTQTVTFTATSTSTKLAFKDLTTDSRNADMLLDNVSVRAVTPVPGPEAGAGLGALALGGLALVMKRRRKSELVA